MTKTIVLVHGAWHTGKCWEPMKRMLEERGYTVYAPTYPGNAAGDDTHVKPEDYLRWIQDVINAIDGKVIVVGHSSAGIIMSGGLAAVKDKVELAVFNNAFVPPDGCCQFDCIEKEVVEAFTAVAGSRPDGCVPADPAFIRAKLMQFADEQTFQRLLDEEVVPQPLAIFQTRVETQKFIDSAIPCAMIHCKDDASVPQDFYKQMFQSIGRGRVVEIPGEHELLVSQPEKLTAALLELLEG